MYKFEMRVYDLRKAYESLLSFKGQEAYIRLMHGIDKFHSYSCYLVFKRNWKDCNESYIFLNIEVDGNYVYETEKLYNTENFDELSRLFYNARQLFSEKVREEIKKGIESESYD